MAAMTRIDELMTSTPFMVDRTDLVGPIRDKMLDSGVHCLPVVDSEGHPAGIVTSWDLVEEYGPEESIENAMTARVITVGAHQTVNEAAALMQTNFIHHLVVVDPENEVVGILSSLDLLGEFIDDDQLPRSGFQE